MELIYLYIKKYENIFEDKEFNFSSNYVASLKSNQLVVEENENAIKQYYGENVNNVVMFLGQNGVGKSTLLDILGMTRDDRCEDTYIKQSRETIIKSSYFMLYHLYDDYFGFEFVDNSFIIGKDKINNISIRAEDEGGALYKLPMGTIFKLENGVFNYCDNIILNWRQKKGVKNKLEYAYITSDIYNSRISNKYNRYYEEYMFQRKYILEENYYEHLYKYFVYLKEINNELLQEKNIFIKNNISVEFNVFDRAREEEEYLAERKQELDKLFGLKSKIQIQIEEMLAKEKTKKDTRSKKERFLQTFYAEAIEYYFLEQLIGWSKNEGLKINIETPIPSLDEVELEINNLESDEKKNIFNGTMDIMIFQYEYAILQYIIKKHTDENGSIDLKAVLTYILTRVEMAAKSTVDICDKQAILETIVLLEELPTKYFKGKKTIKIDCEEGTEDPCVIELLKCYDKYYKIRNNEDGSNNLFRMLSIEISKMSEGQRAFLDIVSKCVSAIYSLEEGDSLILLIDEPDRALHPELSRKFLDALLNTVAKCKGRSVQIVLTSHSPFIVTDILPENVYAIDMQNGVRVIRTNQDTYATNIYYLLMDSFMLSNTFGEYSNKQLKRIVKLLSDSNEINYKRLEHIKKIIDRIGENTVKNKLMELYKKHDNSKSKLVEQLLIEKDDEKLRKIREILENND